MELLLKSLLAGLVISMAGIGYLQVGGLAGAVLFAWGLITVVQLKLKLFTGAAGFFKSGKEFGELILILLGNVVGCIFAAQLFAGVVNVPYLAAEIVNHRLATGPIYNFFLSIGCGIIMTNAVYFARGNGEYKYLPLIYGVPLFIMCGFPHCIADAFYIAAANTTVLDFTMPMVLLNWVASIGGNFIGCNLFRWCKAIK